MAREHDHPISGGRIINVCPGLDVSRGWEAIHPSQDLFTWVIDDTGPLVRIDAGLHGELFIPLLAARRLYHALGAATVQPFIREGKAELAAEGGHELVPSFDEEA